MKTIQVKWLAILSVMLITLISCGRKVHVEKDDNTDFSRYKTFAWVDKDGQGKKDRNSSNDLMEQKFKQAVSNELEKQGWAVDNRRPDVLVSYDVLVERENRVQSDAVYSQPFARTFFNPYSRRFYNVYYPSQFMGYDDRSVSVKEGTVTITITDAKTEKAVWQGWTTDEVNSRNLTSKEISSAVKSIFKKFDMVKK
jgi:Domain of unknown function (DUF4136)